MMSSQELTSVSPPTTMQSIEVATSHTTSLLFRLPSSVYDLVLSCLSRRDKLDFCSHVSKQTPPLTPAAFRHDELRLTASSAKRLSHSPRLRVLLSQISHVSLDIELTAKAGASDDVIMRLLSECCMHFSALSRLSIVWTDGHHGVWLPDLQQRSQSTIRSLALDCRGSPMDLAAVRYITSPLLLSSLRNLYLAVTLHPSSLHDLLQQPLHVLDLSDSCLANEAAPLLPPASEWLSLATCRVLKLPQSRYLTSDSYLDSIVQQLAMNAAATGTAIDTLGIAHVMDSHMATALLDSPLPHTLHISIDGHRAEHDTFLALATFTSTLHSAPVNVHLRITAWVWRNSVRFRHCLAFIRLHSTRIRSVTVLALPRDVTHTLGRQSRWPGELCLPQHLMAAASHCTRLESFVVTPSPCVSAQWDWLEIDVRTLSQPAQWAQPLWLPQLRTLSVFKIDPLDMSRLIAATPSLTHCSLDLLRVPPRLLHLLAASCPQLQTLQVRAKQGPLHFVPASAADEEKQQRTTIPSQLNAPHTSHPHIPFRCLTSLTLQGWAWWSDTDTDTDTSASDFTSVSPSVQLLLAGAPLRRLQLLRWSEAQSELHVLLPIVLSLPRLEVLSLQQDSYMTLEQLTPPAAWDVETSDVNECDVKPTPPESSHQQQEYNNSTTPHPLSLPLSDELRITPLIASPLHSLELTVSPTAVSLKTHPFATLVSHLPHLTGITVTLEVVEADFVSGILHTLGLIGTYAPSIEVVRFVYRNVHGKDRSAASRQVLDVTAVQLISRQYALPTHAFARLHTLRAKEFRGKALIEAEAAEWLQGEWFGDAPLDDEGALVGLMEPFIGAAPRARR